VKVLATYNIKGGVGKTSAAVNLAYLAARDGARTLLWDLDPQGAASFLFRIKPKVKGGGGKLVRGRTDPMAAVKGTDFKGLDLLPADFSYRNLDLVLDAHKRPTRRLRRIITPLADEYDVVVLDCAPSISLVSESVFDASDALLVPLIPTTLSLRTFEQLRDFLVDGVERRPELIAFFSMADRRKRLHREVMESLPKRRSGLAETVIPSSTDVEQMGVRRAPVVEWAPRSTAARAYEALWAEVCERTDLEGAWRS
jgi:chromosome partitioning protein